MGDFVVVVPQVVGYPHTEAFREAAETVLFGLRRLGHGAELGTEPRRGARNIVFGAHCLSRAFLAPGHDLIVYNFEPPQSALLELGMAMIGGASCVWDYSPLGTEHLRSRGIEAIYVPLGYTPELERLSLSDEPTIDVLFYGSINARRAHILNELERRGLRVEAHFGVYGAARDRLIEQARLVLNVHFYEGAPLEDARLTYLLANRVAIVTETPSEHLESAGGRHRLLCATYDQLADICVEWSSRPNDLRLWANAGHEAFALEREDDILLKALAAC